MRYTRVLRLKEEAKQHRVSVKLHGIGEWMQVSSWVLLATASSTLDEGQQKDHSVQDVLTKHQPELISQRQLKLRLTWQRTTGGPQKRQ